MLAKIQKRGNSQGLRLTKELLEDARLDVGDEVEVDVKNGVMIVKPAKRIKGKHNIEDLVACISKNHEIDEVDWGNR